MRTGLEKALAGGCLLFILAGCGHASRSPQDLLSLSVSGLSGVDQYGFRGDTWIGADRRSADKTFFFQGTVENHNHVVLQGDGMQSLTNEQFHPLKLLTDVENGAVHIQLVPEESNNQQSVLRMTADATRAASLWAERLRGEFDLLEKKLPATIAATSLSGQVRSQAAQKALQDEWHGELARSRRELEIMLSSLQVQTTSKLVIDRKKLLPLSLEEQTFFQYRTADGQPAKESRWMRLFFHKPNGQKW